MTARVIPTIYVGAHEKLAVAPRANEIRNGKRYMPEEKKDELVHLTIDDIPVAVPPGTLVWAAAREAGVEGPIYCYHPHKPPLGACRNCFVDIEKNPQPSPTACYTPVTQGRIV